MRVDEALHPRGKDAVAHARPPPRPRLARLRPVPTFTLSSLPRPEHVVGPGAPARGRARRGRWSPSPARSPRPAAAQAVDDLTDEPQAQPEAAEVPCGGHARSAPKMRWRCSCGDADAPVAHLQRGARVLRAHHQLHRRPGAVLQRVGEQVRHHLLQPQPVPLARHGSADSQPEGAARARSSRLEALGHLAHQHRRGPWTPAAAPAARRRGGRRPADRRRAASAGRTWRSSCLQAPAQTLRRGARGRAGERWPARLSGPGAAGR